MSYSNPQRIINKQFSELDKLSEKFNDTSEGYFNLVQQQKAQAARLEEKNVEKESILRDKVNEFAKPGAGMIAENTIRFWDTKIEDYVNNLNLAANGEISQREAMMRNKKIEGLTDLFLQNGQSIAAGASMQDDYIQNGTMSTTGSMANKEVLDRYNNNGYIDIVEQDGNIYYWAPDMDEDGKPIPDSGVFLNGSEMYMNPDKPLVNQKADITGFIQTGYNKFGQEETGFSNFYKDIVVTNGDIDPRDPTGKTTISGMEDGYEQVIRVPSTDPNAKKEFIGDVESSAYLTPMVNDQKQMLSVWQDVIPDGEEQEDGSYTPNSLGSFTDEAGGDLGISLADMGITMEQWQNSTYGELPENLSPEQQSLIKENQQKAAKRYMSNSMWDENALTVPKTLQGKRKIAEPKKGNTTSRFTKGQQTVYDMRKDDYIANRDAANEMYSNGTPDAQTFMTQLQESAPEKYKDVFINDKGLIQSGNSIINIPTSAKAANIILNSDSGIDRTMQNIFEKENPYEEVVEEEEENINQTNQPPKGATVYKSSATEKRTFDGVLTEDEILLFNNNYPDEEITNDPMYQEEIDKLSQNPPSGMSRKAYAQSPELKEKALLKLKRKKAIEDKADAKEFGESLEEYYS